jgi:hypothetical protein
VAIGQFDEISIWTPDTERERAWSHRYFLGVSCGKEPGLVSQTTDSDPQQVHKMKLEQV